MADIKPIVWHRDEEPIEENGHKGRFILPRPQRDRCSTRFPAPPRGPIVRDFSVRFGDCSANEAAQYAANLNEAPQRAMAGYDDDQYDRRRFDKMLRAATMLNLLPDAPQFLPVLQPGWPWWEILIQWNVKPLLLGGRWRSPSAAVGRKRTVAGEFLIFDLRCDPGDPKEQGKEIILPMIPIGREQYHLEIMFLDGRGGTGFFQAKLNGKVVCEYCGPLGYAGYGQPYLAHGIYRSPNSRGLTTVRYEGLVEGIAA